MARAAGAGQALLALVVALLAQAIPAVAAAAPLGGSPSELRVKHSSHECWEGQHDMHRVCVLKNVLFYQGKVLYVAEGENGPHRSSIGVRLQPPQLLRLPLLVPQPPVPPCRQGGTGTACSQQLASAQATITACMQSLSSH